MEQYIKKSTLVAEIEKQRNAYISEPSKYRVLSRILSLIDTLEVKDPYDQYIQYDSIKAGIQANAEIYSFNIESELFNQLTKEQQGLWRKEIEQAYTIGGETGIEFARDTRYNENLEMEEVDLDKHLKEDIEDVLFDLDGVAVKGATSYLTVEDVKDIAKHFFELGLKAKGE